MSAIDERAGAPVIVCQDADGSQVPLIILPGEQQGAARHLESTPAAPYEPAGDLALLLIPFVEDATRTASALTARFGSLAAVFAAAPSSLVHVFGMTREAARFIKLVRRISESLAREAIADRPLIGSWTALNEYLRTSMRGHAVELVRGLFLDRKNHLLADVVMGRGTVDHVPLYPREVVRLAIQFEASALILVHNHPSGDATPSQADISTTKSIQAALSTIEVAFHDHVIVGKNEIVSLRSQRLI